MFLNVSSTLLTLLSASEPVVFPPLSWLSVSFLTKLCDVTELSVSLALELLFNHIYYYRGFLDVVLYCVISQRKRFLHCRYQSRNLFLLLCCLPIENDNVVVSVLTAIHRAELPAVAMAILFAVVARGTTILAKHAWCGGNFLEVTEQILAKIPSENNKLTYSHGR